MHNIYFTTDTLNKQEITGFYSYKKFISFSKWLFIPVG